MSSDLTLAQRVWRSPVLLPAALFLGSLAAALHSALPLTEGRLVYALDDAYIHMAVGRNLASHGVWGCTPYHFASASSSLLWTFALGVLDRVLQVHDSIPLALNVVLALATLATASRANTLARRAQFSSKPYGVRISEFSCVFVKFGPQCPEGKF